MDDIDYYETFAPVAKIVIVKILTAIATMKNWDLHQLDVNNGFRYDDLQEHIYLKPRSRMIDNKDKRVCKLKSSYMD